VVVVVVVVECVVVVVLDVQGAVTVVSTVTVVVPAAGLVVVVVVVVVVAAVVVVVVLETVPMYVEFKSPHLMFPKVTKALADCDSTVAGAPEVVAHDPRATPGEVTGEVVG